MLADQPSLLAGHVLGSGGADPLRRAVRNAGTHCGKARYKPPLCSSAPADLTPLCIFEHGVCGAGFNVGHVPNTRSPTVRHREDQLHVCRVDFLVPGNADGPAQTPCAQGLPERRREAIACIRQHTSSVAGVSLTLQTAEAVKP